ncbi:MAG: hypothetical protein LBU65_17865 [Planctomycetaceae bacterium]|jgi:hypothetical protein|nr:hypothetical protein [Planctomycetaceae bacterium]
MQFHTLKSALTFSLPFLLAVFFFRNVLFFGGAFAFRDVAHYYHPQNAWIDAAILNGESLTWMPYENYGQPLAATATAAVFYPVKWLRVLVADKILADALYIGLHLLLASITSFRLARHFRCSPLASLFGCIAYTFSGSVLYQYVNEPFLVGAALMPEAILQLDRLLHTKHNRSLFAAAIIMSLMILGGDPQAVYHTGIIAVMLIVVTTLSIQTVFLNRFKFKRVSLVAAAFLLTALLAAIQIIPSYELTRLSDRVLSPDTHRTAIYEFSVPPIRLLEFMLPNFGGLQFPVNSRWMNFYEPRVWTPTLFMGAVTMLLAVMCLRFCKRRNRFADRPVIFASWLAVFALLASPGQSGGVYSLLLELPFYSSFRYPAKWLPAASLAIALLAARGFDRLLSEHKFRSRFLITAALLTTVLAIYVTTASFIGTPIPDNVPSCVMFGTYDAAIGNHYFLLSFVQAITAMLAAICALGMKTRNRRALLMLTILCVELVVANQWIIATCSREAFEPKSKLWDAMVGQTKDENRTTPIRVYRAPLWYPREFVETSSSNRLEESICWDVATLWTKYHILYNMQNERQGQPTIMQLDVRDTMISGEYSKLLNQVRNAWYKDQTSFENKVKELGAEYLITPTEKSFNSSFAKPIAKENAATLWRITNPNKTAKYDTKETFKHLQQCQEIGKLITFVTLLCIVFQYICTFPKITIRCHQLTTTLQSHFSQVGKDRQE